LSTVVATVPAQGDAVVAALMWSRSGLVHGEPMDDASRSLVSRRDLLTVAVAGVAATGSGLWPAAAGVNRSQPSRMSSVTPDWAALDRAVRGPVLRPGAAGYTASVRTFDPRRDQLQPAAVVQVTSEADIAACLRFARRYRLGLRPRAGGHSYVGASTGNGVLVVDTRRLNTVRLDADHRKLTVGAGAALGAVHRVLDGYGRTVPTGTCPTVGVAGLALGGGVGAESRLYGLTLDAVTSIRLVTGDGKARSVSPTHQPDLFWALRGGGGGNFGVVTQFGMRTYPAHNAEFFFLTWSASHAAAVLRGWQERLPAMPRTSWANVHLDAVGGTVRPRIVGVAWGASGRAEAQALIRAVGRPPVSATYRSTSHSGAIAVLAGPSGTVRQSWVAGSDVINRPLSAAKARAVVAVVKRRGAAGGGGALIFDPLDGAVHDGSTRTSSFPWRSAVASLQWYVGLPAKASSATVASARAFIARGHAAVGAGSVGGYLNYLEPKRPLRAYYGKSWTNLVKANAKYDPAGVFTSAYSLPD
jgi:FAD/FMN-containing dehydrogenase